MKKLIAVAVILICLIGCNKKEKEVNTRWLESECVGFCEICGHLCYNYYIRDNMFSKNLAGKNYEYIDDVLVCNECYRKYRSSLKNSKVKEINKLIKEGK